MITTVLGDISPDQLGPVDCHDHFFIRQGYPTLLEPDFLLDDVEAAVREAQDLLRAGGQAVLDCMPVGAGRDADALVELARRTGLTVIAVTGFHKERYYADDHWMRRMPEAAIAELLISEATQGMQRSPYSVPSAARSTARAGVIKVAATGEQPTPLEAKQLAAAGVAAASTGLPVLCHTETFTGAMRQLEALQRCGVRPDRVILSHMDRHCEPTELARACRTGATVCLDWLGRLDRRPDDVVVELVTGLVSAGLGDRVVLGQDLARRQYWRGYGGGPGMRHLFATFLPMLRRAGISDEDINQIVVQTPRRVLAKTSVEGP